MGFQPQGDLPDGIIIPPPVAGNCTECDYDYDYVEVGLESFFYKKNRMSICLFVTTLLQSELDFFIYGRF